MIHEVARDVLFAETGKKAIELCRSNPDIDLVLMDIFMPEMSGLETTRQIRQFNREIVIIAQTTYVLNGDRERTIAAGCNDYIAKPYSHEDLLVIIRNNFDN